MRKGNRSLRTLGAGLAAVLVTALLAALPAPGRLLESARAEAPTVSVDNLRTGWDRNEPGLAPSGVASSDFGRLFSTAVDGQVYAQPVIAGGTLVVATETDNVYGLDPATGAVIWRRSVGPAWPAAVSRCGDLLPSIGITSTPVYDPATRSVLFVAKVDDGPSVDLPSLKVHALDAATGAERPGFPRTIAGAPSNDPAHPFTAKTAMQRPGLLLLDGVVYAAFGSLCDVGPFVGYVVGVNAASGAQTAMWSTEAGTSYAEAGIWQSGGGLVSDGPGRILLTTGNGVSPAPGPGTSPPGTLAESVVRLAVAVNGSLAARDYFSPYDNIALDQNDTDLGSGGPMALPAGFGPPGSPNLLVQSGKDGRVYLLNRDDLGGTAQAPGGRDRVVAVSGPYNGQWNHPTFWGGDGGYVYISEAGYLRAHKYGVTGTGLPTLASVGTSPGGLGFGTGSPIVTSTGTAAGSALVWLVRLGSANGDGAELRAYDAVPVGGVLRLRWSAPIGIGTKFAVPATDGGRVFVGTRDGHVLGFGRPTTSPLTASPVVFGSVPVGTTAQRTVTLTATRTATVTGIGTAAPFGVPGPPALPRTLAAGQQLAVPVSFTPTAAGSASTGLTLTTTAGPAVVALQGTGTSPGLGAPASLDFGEVPTGGQRDLTVTVTNTGTSPETVTGATAPHAPFSVAALPPTGSTIAPGASVAVSVSYRPTVARADRDALAVTSTRGAVTVALTGNAVQGAPHLTVTPNPLGFGDVAIGLSVTRTFDVVNTGNLGLTISKAAPPAGVFSSTNPLPEGQYLAPGAEYHQAVTFTPTAAGAVSGTYQITGNDGRGPQNLVVTGNGTSDPISVKVAQLVAAGVPLGGALGTEQDVPGGRLQVFGNGQIFWSPATGAHVLSGAILVEYLATGATAGPLGFPIGDELVAPDLVGRYSQFAAGGAIYWTPATGAHEVHGAIYARWAASGWETGSLGYPVTDELGTPDGVGRFTHFSKVGSIYWTPATGPHLVTGAIHAEWAATGWEAGPLGYPTTDELTTPDTIGRYNHFTTGGSVYWTPDTGAHEVHGLIAVTWAATGWETGRLGYPTTDEYAVPGGRRNDFVRGSLTWDAASGQVR